MAVTLYSITLFVHILSVFLWFATIPISSIIDRVVKNITETAKQYSTMQMASVNGKISGIAALLVFLTGSIMVEAGEWGWAPESGQFWLVTKQTIWLLLLIASFVIMKPLETQLNGLIDADAGFEQVYAVFKTITIRGHMLSGFVMLNVFLATTKPF